MTKQMCETLIARFTELYQELASEKEELDSVHWRIRSENSKIKERDIPYSEYEDIKKVIKKVNVSLLPFLDNLTTFQKDKQLIDLGRDISYTYTYLTEVKYKNFSPFALSDSIVILLKQISFSISVWQLRNVFLNCAAHNSEDSEVLLACADSADRIYPILYSAEISSFLSKK